MKEKSGISRREFLLLSAGVGAAIVCPTVFSGCVESFCDDLNPTPGYQPLVSNAWVKKGELEASYSLFKAAVEAATDFAWLGADDSVFIHLSLDSGQGYPAVSDPVSLRFMARLLREKGAGTLYAGGKSRIEEVLHSHRDGQPMHWLLSCLHDLLGREDVVWGSTRELAESSGLLAAMRSEGIEPLFFEEEGPKGYELESAPTEGGWISPIHVTKKLKEIDHLVQLARVSHHQVAGVVCGLQMVCGFLRDDSAFSMLAEAPMFHKRCEAINRLEAVVEKRRLVATTATEMMVTDGPDRGVIVAPDYGMICASEDPLANELLATAWYSVHAQQTQGDIYCLPMTRFHMACGGRPEKLRWTQINTLPVSKEINYINRLLKTS